VLKKLTIQNYALIRHLQMEPHAGLNVVTGETGAGKSIMLGALGLLMGNRADTKVLWDAEDKCVTEGEFNLAGYKLQGLFKKEDLDYDDHTVIRREINASGKSRAFINDTPVTLDVLRKITSRLMDIHSQHETLELGSRTFQLQLIDAFAGNQKQREAYEAAWQNFCEAKEAHEQLAQEAEGLKQEADFIQFQLEELKKAQLEPQEQEKLEGELKIQEHAEEIKSRLTQVSQLMGQSDTKIIFKHIIPQLIPLTFASIAIAVPGAILGEAALSFLGLGDPSIPTWGQILNNANSAGAASRGLWWWIAPPGFMIAITGLAFVLIGNALDAIVNPRSRRM